MTIAISSLVSFAVFIPYTNELIVNVTAVYVTILFLEGTLRQKVPLLDVEYIRSTSTHADDSSLVDIDEDNGKQELVKQLIKIKNIGDAPADNIQLKYRVIRSNGEIIKKWSSMNTTQEETWSVAPNSTIKKEIPIAQVDEYSDQIYYIEMKLKPNVRSGHLTVRSLNKTEPTAN